MRNVRQEEALQWLCQVEEIAVRGQVKARLLDEISDCKKELSRELTAQEWQAKKTEMDELLNQLKKQLAYDTEAGKHAEDIARRASDMLGQCRQSGENLGKEYCGSSEVYIQEAERSLQELSNATANYDDVTHREQFIIKVRNISEKYKQQLDHLEEQYVHAVSQNYQNMFDRLKNFFSASGYGKDTERRFYQVYYAKQDVLLQNMTSYADNTEKGESSIVQYAEEVQNPIQEIIKRFKRKAVITKWMPVILILVVIAVNCIYNITMNSAGNAGMQGETENQALIDIGQKAAELGKDMLGDAFKKILKIIVFPLLLLVFFLYWLWMKSVDKHCRNNISREAGRLLDTSYEQWAQQGKMAASIRESFRQTMEYVDTQYSGILTELMNDRHMENADETAFADLCAEWEAIKRKVDF